MISIVPLNFKDSPFFTVVRSLSSVGKCPGTSWNPERRSRSCLVPATAGPYLVPLTHRSAIASETARNTVTALLQKPSDISVGKNAKVMIFCTGDPPTSHQRAEISFPSQVEVKVDGVELRANFRGLKNRPGSTQPADVTDLVKRNPKSQIQITVSYALTNRVRSLETIL